MPSSQIRSLHLPYSKRAFEWVLTSKLAEFLCQSPSLPIFLVRDAVVFWRFTHFRQQGCAEIAFGSHLEVPQQPWNILTPDKWTAPIVVESLRLGHRCGNLTIIHAITAAGGFLSTANKQQILMLRKQSDNPFLTYQINVEDILLNKTPNICLQRTDVLFIPKTAIANAGEFVDHYINAIIPKAIRFNYTYTMVDGENNATGIVVTPNQ